MRIGVLWWKLGKRTDIEYLQGVIRGENIVIFRNNRKMMKDDPDFLVYPNTTVEEREKFSDEAIRSDVSRQERI